MKFYLFIFLFNIVFFKGFAQIPEREFRAIWITTAFGLDFPMQNYNVHEQKKWLVNLVDSIDKAGFNVIFFQVRPMGDAFYPSDLSPWSSALTGQTGEAPTRFFDPLKTIIEAAHDKKIELHAWFNPFRLGKFTWLNDLCQKKIPLGHYFQYQAQYWLDPGHPDSRNFAAKGIAEVVSRYDIDGVHLDDYFYPYEMQNEEIPDEEIFKIFGGLFKDKNEWRRQNINDFIRKVGSEIKREKPYIKFGVSPYGVWRNFTEDASGSLTNSSLCSYSHVFADVKQWIERKWVDYLCPQIYFAQNYEEIPFENVVKWWNEIKTERHIYAGLGLYKVGELSEKNIFNASEIPSQIFLLKKYKNILGFALFRWGNWRDNKFGVCDSLNKTMSQKPLVPQMDWLNYPIPPKPSKPIYEKSKNNIRLFWAFEGNYPEKLSYILLKITETPFENKEEIFYLDNCFFLDKGINNDEKISYKVCTRNRLSHLSDFSEICEIK